MKILHVETGRYLYGGARQVAYLLEGLNEQGIDNVLVCPPGSAIAEHFRGSSVSVVELACSGDLDIGFAFRLKRVIREHSPDVVHLHSRRGADVMGGWGAAMAKAPCVLSRRVDNPEPRAWVAIKYRLYDRVICISEGIADVLRGLGVSSDKLRSVRSSVDAAPWQHPRSRAELDATFGLDADAVVLGVVAQLIPRKGHSILFQALPGLDMPNRVQLICFGQGPQREALEQQVRELGLDARVRFAGFRDDLSDWLGALDIVVHPAFMEGLGVSLLQASAASVPVIASRAGGMPEAVADGVSGVLVPPGDVAALRDAIQRLVSDPALRAQLGRQGRERVESEFSNAVMVAGNLAVYREVLGSSPR